MPKKWTNRCEKKKIKAWHFYFSIIGSLSNTWCGPEAEETIWSLNLVLIDVAESRFEFRKSQNEKKKESIKHKTSSETSESKTRDKLLHVNIDVWIRSGTHSAGFLRCRAINSFLSSKINEGFVAMGNYLFLKNVLKSESWNTKNPPSRACYRNWI